MIESMQIRTVYDSRADQKFYWETLLLAASWHRHVRDKARRPLEVLSVGAPPPPLADFLSGLGVGLREVAPHPYARRLPFANKLQAVLGERRPTLLIDNDTIFLRDWPENADAAGRTVRATLASFRGLPGKIWQQIERALGIKALQLPAVPYRDALQAEIDGSEARPRRRAFFNAGVIAFGSPAEFVELWIAHMRAIAALGRGYHRIGGGDQPGFATAVAAHGDFSELPITCNYRQPCLGLGLAPLEDIVLMHVSGFRFQHSLRDSIHAYWERRILGPLPGTDARFVPRIQIAEAARERILQIVADYALDRLPAPG
jgi:hypothetical protein